MTNGQDFSGNRQAAGASELRQWLRILIARVLLCFGVAFAAVASAEPGVSVVNINSADAETLAEVLDGVGMSRAQAIIEYRDQHGNFRDAYELANIKGIGERTVEINEDRIRLQD